MNDREMEVARKRIRGLFEAADRVATRGPQPARWTGCKVFSATMQQDRDALGDKITAWLQRASVRPVDVVVRQSSDAAFHCLSITVFYEEAK